MMKKALFFCLFFTYSIQSQADNLSNSNRLFDWVETNFSEYFSPAGAETFEINGFLARYYSDTDLYIGTLGNDVYVYGNIFGGLLYVGQISDFVQTTENTGALMLSDYYDYQNTDFSMNNDCRIGMSLLGISEVSLRPNSGQLRVNQYNESTISIDVKGDNAIFGIQGEWIPFNGEVSENEFQARYSTSIYEDGERLDIDAVLSGTVQSEARFDGAMIQNIRYNGYGYNLNCELSANYEANEQ